MDKSGKEQHTIERPAPSRLLIKARELAINQIDYQLKKHCDSNDEKSFHWIKTEWTYPSFEHFTFAHKNQLFPVFVEIIINGVSQMTQNEIDKLLKAAEKYNFVPCVYKVNINESSELTSSEYGYGRQISIKPFSNDEWNLYDLRNGNNVIPESMGNDTLIEMSEWELLDFSIQIVLDDILNQGYKLLSFCSLPGIIPNIWFKNKMGQECWVIVRHINNKEDEDYQKWVDVENNEGIKNFDGYFAGVSFSSKYRGEQSFINYQGMKHIYRKK